MQAKQLVESDKVQVVLGLQGTPSCYAVAQYMQQAKVPTIISGNCGAQTVTTDPKFKSPYVVRLTQNTVGLFSPNGDWAYKQGYKKAILLTSDYGGGLEAGDAGAVAFVKQGGSIGGAPSAAWHGRFRPVPGPVEPERRRHAGLPARH